MTDWKVGPTSFFNGLLWVRCDLEATGRVVDPARIAARPPDLWRYRELLPLPDGAERITLGEGMTPLLPVPHLGTTPGHAPAVCAFPQPSATS